MRIRMTMLCGAAALLCFASLAEAQPGRGPGGFGGGGGISRLALLRIEAVQKELELVPKQIEDLTAAQRELFGGRPGGEGAGPGRRPGGEGAGPGRRPGGENGAAPRRRPGGEGGDRPRRPERPENNEDARSEFQAGEFFVQDEQPPRRNFQDLTEEERAELRERFQQQAAERAKQEQETLAKILLPHQLKRLNEIYIQVAGVRALQDSQVAEALKITDKQKQEMAEVQQSGQSGLRELFQGGDREQIREKMAEFQKEQEEKLLNCLTAQQKAEFVKMKGEKFELPEDALRGGFGPGGRGPGGPGGSGRPGGNRPQRPENNENDT